MTAETAQEFAAVIATKDHPSGVRRLLASLQAQSVRPAQVIMVDAGDGSLREVMAEFQGLPLEYHHEPRPGLTRQKNRGAAAAGPDIRFIAFLDDDIVLERNAFSRMVEFWDSAASDVGGASFNLTGATPRASRVLSRLLRAFQMDDGRFGAVLESGFNTPISNAASTRASAWLNGGSTVWRREVLRRFPFDEWFPGSGLCEDVRFSLQVSPSYRLMVVAEAAAHHVVEPPAGWRAPFRQGIAQVVNRVYLVAVTPGLSGLRCAWALAGQWLINVLLWAAGRGSMYGARAAGNLAGIWRVLRGAASPARGGGRYPERKLRILYLHPTLEVGGAEALRATLLKYLDRDRFEFRLCCIERRGAIGEEIQAMGFPVDVLGCPLRTISLRTTWAVYRYLQQHPADIIQTSLFGASWHGRIAARLAGVPVILTEMHSLHEPAAGHVRYNPRFGWFFRTADRLLAAGTDRLLACSQAVADSVAADERIPPGKFLVLHNVIDPERFRLPGLRQPIRAALGFSAQDIVVGSVGTLKAAKGPLALLEAFAKARQACPALRLILVGDGPLRDQVEAEIRRQGLAEVVRIMGTRRDIADLLSAMDLFVSASVSEGFGINLLEAMAMGLPCVATRVGGVAEVVVHGETGLIVPPADPQALAEAMMQLASDPDAAAYGRAGRERVEMRFLPGAYVRTLTALYEDLAMRKVLEARVRRALRAPERGVLYISYDGLAEPLGQSQVVSYIERLAASHPITVLSYEKSADLRDHARMQALQSRLAAAGIRWVRLRYHKRPSLPATAWDIAAGLLAGWRLCVTRRVRLIHARGYVPSVIALVLQRLCGVKFLFDMRGFWPEEKVEAGHWSRRSPAYRLAKQWERRFFERADAIVSLTRAGVRAFPELGYRIPPATPVVVIPTCVDTRRFRPGPTDEELRHRFWLEGRFVIGCTGTLSSWYLRRETLRFLARALEAVADAVVLVVTREDHARLRADAVAAGIPADRLAITEAAFERMPDYVRLMDAGVFFIRPSRSKRGSAATKLAEFLATGVPVVINDGVGDSGTFVRKHRVGKVLPDVTDAAMAAGVAQLRGVLQDAGLAARCREAAMQHLDLEIGVAAYARLYRRLLGDTTPPRAEPEPPEGRVEPAAEPVGVPTGADA